MNRDVDAALSAAGRGGDFQVSDPDFATFYRENSLWAARLAYLLTGERGFAEDLMQEAFVGLYRRFDTVENPRAYVRVSLVNLANRRRAREQRRTAAHRLVVARAAVNDQADEVFDVIAKLPANQRAVIVLRYFEGLSESEIGAALGCAPGTVKSLASRAIARLRKEIEQ